MADKEKAVEIEELKFTLSNNKRTPKPQWECVKSLNGIKQVYVVLNPGVIKERSNHTAKARVVCVLASNSNITIYGVRIIKE